ncbi:RL192 [Enterospora canceri]|uniref:RL192 n=1 Tax=Enterospora canceri TaxID=1081671 RepID=A0A1Y1S7N9_9MICR|nr:RL192 [Enterospora canceri]
MRKLASIKRMAMKVLNCGEGKLWMDPNELESIMAADSYDRVRELIADNVIIKRDDKVNSRANAEKRAEARKKGRHMGKGSRKGTKNARCSKKTIWIKTIRSIRETLKEMKENGELNSDEYHRYRQHAKGNMFKLNKNTMIDQINRKKQEQLRLAELEKQAQAIRMGNKQN